MRLSTAAFRSIFGHALTLALLGVYQALFFHVNTTSIALISCVILLAGFPHGAADTLIFRRLFPGAGWGRWALFVITYLSLSGLVASMWVFSPSFFLAYLILISAVHFGEDLSQYASPSLGLIYGFSVVLAPSLMWEAQVLELFNCLVGHQAAVEWALVTHHGSGTALFTFTLMLGLHFIRDRNWILIQRTLWPLVALIFLEPMLGFTLYFCCWHSRIHLLRLWHLHVLDRSLLSLTLIAMPMAIIVVAIAIWVKQLEQLSVTYLVQVVFVSLGALTLPHMLLVASLRRHFAQA